MIAVTYLLAALDSESWSHAALQDLEEGKALVGVPFRRLLSIVEVASARQVDLEATESENGFEVHRTY